MASGATTRLYWWKVFLEFTRRSVPSRVVSVRENFSVATVVSLCRMTKVPLSVTVWATSGAARQEKVATRPADVEKSAHADG